MTAPLGIALNDRQRVTLASIEAVQRRAGGRWVRVREWHGSTLRALWRRGLIARAEEWRECSVRGIAYTDPVTWTEFRTLYSPTRLGADWLHAWRSR